MTLSRGGAPPLGENQGGRKWRLEGAAAKVRVNEEEVEVGVRRRMRKGMRGRRGR